MKFRLQPHAMNRCAMALALLGGVLAGGCQKPPEQAAATFQTVATEGGMLRGGVIDGIASYRGIPYAAAPLGELRWRPPHPPAAWQGERDATRLGNECLQNRPWGDWDRNHPPMSEDCLFLNVWASASAVSAAGAEKLPVMFWIHGGAAAIGQGSNPGIGGRRLAAKGVVVVTFNYRLGRFGFFAHPALSKAAGSEPLGNYAIMDQIAALQWVRRNIERFGGDPSNITLFGESAGGDAVQTLMLSPESRGLFAKAIVQSGGGRFLLPRVSGDLPDLPSAETRGVAFAQDLGLVNPDAAALRALPAKKVMGSIGLFNSDAEKWCAEMLDGRIVQWQVLEGFKAGAQAPVPLMVGANGFELGHLPFFVRNKLNATLLPRFGAHAEDIKKAYPDEDVYKVNLTSDFFLVEPALSIARAAAPKQPAYLYRFNYVIDDKREGAKGAAHYTDVAFVFGQLAETGQTISAADRAVEDRVLQLWTSFAKHGKPSAEGQDEWLPYERAQDQLYEIALDGRMSMAPAGKPWLEAITRNALAPALPFQGSSAR